MAARTTTMRLSGGAKLEAQLGEMARALGAGGAVDVGFLSQAKYPDGTSVALIAALQDFGTGTIPPRPFFRGMIERESPGWGNALALNLQATNYDIAATLQRMGLGIKGQLQKSIIDLWAPPLAKSTIARKGFDKPLIETSHMLNSADFRVNT